MKKLNKVFYRTTATLVLAITMAGSFSLTKASAAEPKVVIQSNSDDLNEQKNINEKPKLKLAVVSKSPIGEEVTPPVTEEVTSPVTEEVTSPVTEEVTSPVTEEVTSPVTEEVTSPVTEEVTSPVTEEVVIDEEVIEDVVEEEEFTEVVYEEEFSGITGQPNPDNDQAKIQLASVSTATPKKVETKKVVDQVNIASNESNNSLKTVGVVASSTNVVVAKTKEVASKKEVKSTPTIVTSSAVFLNEGMTSLPQTGENSNQLKVAGLMLLGAFGALMALVLFQRREKHEEIN